MKCPNCYVDNNAVVDSRSKGENQRRIRKCESCGYTFKTIERIYPKSRVTEKPLPEWYAKRRES